MVQYNQQHIIQSLKHRVPSALDLPINQFAALIPLLHMDNELHVLFEVRSKNMNRQPNEVCFPGGRIEQDDASPKHTAIRETCEELGIQLSNIHNVFPLDFIQSGLTIYPYVGFVNTSTFTLNAEEVESTFTVPITHLLSTPPTIHKVELIPLVRDDFPYHLIPNGKNYKWQSRYIDEYFYQYNSRVIWGLTARILSHFIDVIRK